MTFTPGPRQQQQRGTHSKFGPGLAVFENGPSFFIPDAGEPVKMTISLGGASSKPPRQWLRSSEGEIDITNEKRGDSHKRAWHPRMGSGWLVWMPLKEKCCPMRFDADSGEVLSFEWSQAAMGKPGKKPRFPTKDRPGKSPEYVEWSEWTTFTSTAGEVFLFRNSAPVEAVPVGADAAAQGSLFR